jgi:hypothetical protein
MIKLFILFYWNALIKYRPLYPGILRLRPAAVCFEAIWPSPLSELCRLMVDGEVTDREILHNTV